MSDYKAEDIKVLEGLDAVRMRPSMYIGSVGPKGLDHLLWEIVDNAIDEVMGGYADEVHVTIHQDNSVTVTDNGRGIPVGIHPKLKVSGVQVVFTQLHAGGKFDNKTYSFSGGLHGVGASVVNALSRYLTVEVDQNGKRYVQHFESVRVGKKIISGKPMDTLSEAGTTFEHGTKVTYMPDSDVFETIVMNHDTVDRRLRDLAFLNKGVLIAFSDERQSFSPVEYRYEGGISDFVKYLNEDKEVINPEPILIEGAMSDVMMTVGIQYTDSYNESIFSYVNNIPTQDGGTHDTGFKSGLTKAMNEFARKTSLLKDKDDNLTGEDYREGITAVISLKMHNVQFEGQTKSKLGNSDVKGIVDNLVQDRLSAWLGELKNAEIANKIVAKAIKAAEVRAATRKAKETARHINSLEGTPLVGKLSSCTGKKPWENELFIVEGDSAGGSAKKGRNRHFQAILPLRGKPLNVERKRLDAVLTNEEFRSIITALGAGIGEDFDVSSIKYHKVIILSDADQDGAHIRAILITFFYRYMKALISEGHLYIAQAPLYKVSRGSASHYAYDEKQLQKYSEELGKGYTIQRFKGLGEMDAEQLEETTLSPDSRVLLRVTIDDASEADHMISLMMGDKVEPRRDFIIKNANFNKVDAFMDMV